MIQGCGYLLAVLDPTQKEPYTQPIRTVMDKWLKGIDGIEYTPQVCLCWAG